ncbi:hypothetical protein [Burkholderia pyrrocinia]|uniref:hypothetical protein n=1 Tax=Burkholderia pyrrocinia TaxID=60550 RepID=UPI00158DFE41|nr:hypothetical protein [Burkholderia pyrrocinia]
MLIVLIAPRRMRVPSESGPVRKSGAPGSGERRRDHGHDRSSRSNEIGARFEHLKNKRFVTALRVDGVKAEAIA